MSQTYPIESNLLHYGMSQAVATLVDRELDKKQWKNRKKVGGLSKKERKSEAGWRLSQNYPINVPSNSANYQYSLRADLDRNLDRDLDMSQTYPSAVVSNSAKHQRAVATLVDKDLARKKRWKNKKRGGGQPTKKVRGLSKKERKREASEVRRERVLAICLNHQERLQKKPHHSVNESRKGAARRDRIKKASRTKAQVKHDKKEASKRAREMFNALFFRLREISTKINNNK